MASGPKPDPVPGPARETVDVLEALQAAVAGVGGEPRDGQRTMVEAVRTAMESGEHLLVQAGTGTGKSLAYLVPAVLHVAAGKHPVVVATATIALQRQLIERDLPLLADSLEPLLGRRPEFAILKGRQHYACLLRLAEGAPDDAPGADDQALFAPAPTTALGRDVLRIRAWVDETRTGDRDELVPAPAERAWRASSVTSHECVGATRCAHGDACFAELARERARRADVVVTNHAMLAIDAFAGIPLLPEHDVVVVDEAHELVDRATGAVTDELTAGAVERAARRIRRYVAPETHDALVLAGEALGEGLAGCPPGRLEAVRGLLFDALVAVRDVGHLALTETAGKDRSAPEGGVDPARTQARAAVEELHEIAGRVVAAGPSDVLWATAATDRRPAVLYRAPMSVAGLLREQLFGQATVVLTSATLELGGSFDSIARGLGLLEPDSATGDDAPASAGRAVRWTGLDVGSPFDYARQAILYVAAHLPPPGREGLAEATLDELAGLVEAAGGRTLGLFSSQRAAVQAAEAMRERLDVDVLCQGDDATAELVRRFSAERSTCLFGTLSLWQGVDVPGAACHLVVIDRIPFPRPDDPLVRARQDAAGPAGFMTVSAASAALLLAQGSGRLIRSSTDRGVVAVLDSRLSTARYAGFLRRSLPPFWPTEDGEQVRRSLRALAAADSATDTPAGSATEPVAPAS
ncbi:MAG: ATP-dependent DNA helicase [Actinomycetes bacterium]